MTQDNRDLSDQLVHLELWDRRGLQEIQASKVPRDSQVCLALLVKLVH